MLNLACRRFLAMQRYKLPRQRRKPHTHKISKDMDAGLIILAIISFLFAILFSVALCKAAKHNEYNETENTGVKASKAKGTAGMNKKNYGIYLLRTGKNKKSKSV